MYTHPETQNHTRPPRAYPENTVDFLRQRGYLVVEHRFAFVRAQRAQTKTAQLIEIRRGRGRSRGRRRCRRRRRRRWRRRRR